MKQLSSVVELNEHDQKLLSIAGKVFQESIIVSRLKPEERIIEDLDDLAKVTSLLKNFGAKIVLTMGTFDLLHVGHARYIRKAREAGSLLIVGVEDDEKARGRKGENRPAVPYFERSELLTYLRSADIVAKKNYTDRKWEMIKIVRPHVLFAVTGTYTDEEIEALKEYCQEVRVLERQAETSTSAKIRRMVLDGADVFRRILSERLPEFILSAYEQMKKGGGL